MNAFFFYVETPAGMAMTWIGGALKPSDRPDHIWLTRPNGDPVLELPRECVHESNLQDTAKRMRLDRMASKSVMN
jgi:hypothetical protein